MRQKKGFTLAELLIVVAIIAVLVAIAIPVFSGKLEKARRAVDMHTARSIESILLAAVNDGTVEIRAASSKAEVGIWVLICRDKNSWPEAYDKGKKTHDTAFCGAEGNIVVAGTINNNDKWNWNNDAVESIVKQAGINLDTLKVKSNGKGDGWDWIIIEAGYLNNKVFSRIYSGFKGDKSSIKDIPWSTNIEKAMG